MDDVERRSDDRSGARTGALGERNGVATRKSQSGTPQHRSERDRLSGRSRSCLSCSLGSVDLTALCARRVEVGRSLTSAVHEEVRARDVRSER